MNSKCLSCGKEFNITNTEHYCPDCSSKYNSFEIFKRKNNPLILIVEDTKFFAKFIGDKLTKEGYEVIYAFDGEQALIMIKNLKPTLIILDLLLPKIDGFEIISRVKSSLELRHIPILAMSEVYVKLENIAYVHSLGADGFILKKAIKDNLIFRVKQLIRGENNKII